MKSAVVTYVVVTGVKRKGKSKGKVVPVSDKHPATKTYGGMEAQEHAFLTSGLHGGEWSASSPGRFTYRKRAPGTQLIGRWVGLRASMDVVAKRKIPRTCRESNRGRPA